MTFAGHEIIIDLLDTPMVHAFLTQRPMTLMSEDFNGNEKNNYLQQKLSIASDIHAEETKGNFFATTRLGEISPSSIRT